MSHSDSAPGRRPRPFILICGLLILAVGASAYWLHRGTERAQAQRPPSRPAAPVTVATVARQDVPIHLIGLGTVQATFTVGIHSQVDGKLQEVLFAEGQHVKKGDVLAKIDPRLFQAALDQAKAKKAQDEANLVALQKDLERYKTLATKGFQSQQNIDQQQAKVDSTKASIEADKALIEAATTQLEYTNIVAPSDGRMGMRLIDPGNIVRASDQASIAILTLTQPVNVVFTLPERTLDDVREAMARGPVEVVAYDRDNKKALSTGKLQTIDNMIDPTTGTYKLKAVFANADERLWPGEFVNARLLVAVKVAAMVIPNAALQRGPAGPFTWVVTAQNTAEARLIQIDSANSDVTMVTSGLKDGERVVTDGQYKLLQGAPVTILAAPAAGS